MSLIRPSLVVASLALAVAAVPAQAKDSVTKCKVGAFYLAESSGSASVSRLRAVNLPKKTDGYAPRCLVADALAGLVQSSVRDDGVLPTFVKPMGARWYGGEWRCQYTDANGQSPAATCRKIGKTSRRVTFTLSNLPD